MTRHMALRLILAVGIIGCRAVARSERDGAPPASPPSPPPVSTSIVVGAGDIPVAPPPGFAPISGQTIRLGKGQMLVVQRPEGVALLEFTEFREGAATYRWRARSKGRQGRGTGTVAERYLRSPTNQLTDNGSDLLVGAGLFSVQWSYADTESGWLYLDPSVGQTQVMSSATFEEHPLRLERQQPVALDSLVLERTPCFGTCPAYRLSIRANGAVQFVSRNRADSGRTASQSIGPMGVRRLELVLASQQFTQLPEIRMGERPYCRAVATDAPTITLTMFQTAGPFARSYYTGCGGESAGDTVTWGFIRRLRTIADSVDAIAAGKDWIRPGRR